MKRLLVAALLLTGCVVDSKECAEPNDVVSDTIDERLKDTWYQGHGKFTWKRLSWPKAKYEPQRHIEDIIINLHANFRPGTKENIRCMIYEREIVCGDVTTCPIDSCFPSGGKEP